MTILATGVPYHYFKVDGKRLQAGQYDYEIKDGRLTVWNIVGSNKFQPIINNVLLEDILDGDNSNTPFANQAAIETWLEANFFF